MARSTSVLAALVVLALLSPLILAQPVPPPPAAPPAPAPADGPARHALELLAIQSLAREIEATAFAIYMNDPTQFVEIRRVLEEAWIDLGSRGERCGPGGCGQGGCCQCGVCQNPCDPQPPCMWFDSRGPVVPPHVDPSVTPP